MVLCNHHIYALSINYSVNTPIPLNSGLLTNLLTKRRLEYFIRVSMHSFLYCDASVSGLYLLVNFTRHHIIGVKYSGLTCGLT